jgi:2-polyprenyl-3-methyl-5-hydroxy-6-metoxy-1,4-benzoquinol methylase
MSLFDRRNSIVGLDILASMIDGMSTSIARMRNKGIEFDLTAVCGDICNPEFENGSFDAIYSIEAIEHVHDLKTMFERCFELLKPGGPDLSDERQQLSKYQNQRGECRDVARPRALLGLYRPT